MCLQIGLLRLPYAPTLCGHLERLLLVRDLVWAQNNLMRSAFLLTSGPMNGDLAGLIEHYGVDDDSLGEMLEERESPSVRVSGRVSVSV